MQFLAAAVQMLATSDKEANLREAEGWIRRAHAEGARVVVLPEVFNWRGTRQGHRGERGAGAWAINGAHVHLGYRARFVSAGRVDPGGLRPGGASLQHQRAHWSGNRDHRQVSKNPLVRRRYRRARTPFRESEFRRPGDAVVVADTPLCPMGLSVCYDLRFPELYRQLSAAGAKVIFVPSVFTVPTGRAHWEALLRARAIENQDLHHRPRPDRRPPRQHVGLRTLHDRRSMGYGHRQGRH